MLVCDKVSLNAAFISISGRISTISLIYYSALLTLWQKEGFGGAAWYCCKLKVGKWNAIQGTEHEFIPLVNQFSATTFAILKCKLGFNMGNFIFPRAFY